MSIKFPVLGGGYFGFLRGGECRFYFYGRADFSDNCSHRRVALKRSPLQAVLILEHATKRSTDGALRKGPPFHGWRSSREIEIQNASCQMGGRKVTK